MVDIRDVSEMYLNALLDKEAANKRFVVVGESLWLTEIAAILKDKYEGDY